MADISAGMRCHQSSSAIRVTPADRSSVARSLQATIARMAVLQRPQCFQIAVVVVIVTQEHVSNRRQIVEANARLTHAPAPSSRTVRRVARRPGR